MPMGFLILKRGFRLLVFVLSGCGSLSAAVHLTYKVERQYFGQVQQMPDVEIWFSDSVLCFVRGKQKILYSWMDAKKTAFSIDGQRCFQSGIDERITAPASTVCPVQYLPKYYWNVLQRLPNDTLRNVPCVHLVLEGQDAYSEKRVDVWVAREVPEFLKPFPERRARCRLFADDGTMDFFDSDSVLKNGVVFRQIDVVTPPNPVPDFYVVTAMLTVFEEGDAPEGLFTVPAEVKRVRTADEL
jgi:hypothetical protein